MREPPQSELPGLECLRVLLVRENWALPVLRRLRPLERHHQVRLLRVRQSFWDIPFHRPVKARPERLPKR